MLNALFPAMNAVDAWLASGLPLMARISLWGILSGAASMGLYAAVSNQKTISSFKTNARELRRRMADPSLEEFSDFLALAKENIGVSLKLLGIVMGPVFIAVLPVLVTAAWIDTFHGHSLPEKNKAVAIAIIPAGSSLNIQPPDIVQGKEEDRILIRQPLKPSEQISFYVNNGLVYKGDVFTIPAPVIAKKKWWNLILASRAGYLTNKSPVEEIHFDFPRQVMHDGLPGWASGWEWTFFLSILIVSLPIKIIFKIH